MTLTPEEQASRRASMQKIMTGTPYMNSLGLVVEKWDDESVRMRLPFDERLSNDGAVHHGGVVASLMDSVGAGAVWAGHDFDKGVRAATISMTVNYTGAAPGSDLIGEGRCVRRGRDLAFSEIRITDPNGKLVATGSLVYRIVP